MALGVSGTGDGKGDLRSEVKTGDSPPAGKLVTGLGCDGAGGRPARRRDRRRGSPDPLGIRRVEDKALVGDGPGAARDNTGY